MKKLLLLGLLLTSCTTVSQPELFLLGQGETMVCQSYEQEECGMALRHCGEAKSVDFECQSDVKYVGKSADHKDKTAVEEPKVPADYAPAAQDDFTTPTVEGK